MVEPSRRRTKSPRNGLLRRPASIKNYFPKPGDRNQRKSPVPDIHSLQAGRLTIQERPQRSAVIAAEMPDQFVIARVEPLKRRNIDDDPAAGLQMPNRSFQEPRGVVDVLQHVKKDDSVIG